jgi:S-adenosylmethionine hydrolase
MPLLTLTTDWGLRDHYLAAFKGELLRRIPTIQIIDISHEVSKFNSMQAAFIVQNSFQKFPEGSIHFISVSGNENGNIKNPHVIIHANGHYLIGEDNGVFSLILGDSEKEIIRLPLVSEAERNEVLTEYYHSIKRMCDGDDFRQLGTPDSKLVESYFAFPTVDNQFIRGTIIYIDSFGNAVINIKKDLFDKERKGRSFTIFLRKSSYDIKQISQVYHDVDIGEIVALFNQDGFLEIALNRDAASKLLGLKLMDTIRIEFNDNQVG